jgi:hypothetical protein
LAALGCRLSVVGQSKNNVGRTFLSDPFFWRRRTVWIGQLLSARRFCLVPSLQSLIARLGAFSSRGKDLRRSSPGCAAPRRIPRTAGESAGLRDDAFVEGVGRRLCRLSAKSKAPVKAGAFFVPSWETLGLRYRARGAYKVPIVRHLSAKSGKRGLRLLWDGDNPRLRDIFRICSKNSF